MGSSFYSPFLLPSLLSGIMSLKVIVVLCGVLIGLLEANPVGVEEHNSSASRGSGSEDITGNGELKDNMSREAGADRRKKRACAWNPIKQCCYDYLDCTE